MDSQQKEVFKRLMFAMRKIKQLNIDVSLQAFDMTPTEFAVLHLLERTQKQGEDAMTISDVAKQLNNATSTISPIIQSLVEKGYVTRTTSVRDRRVAMIALTDEGDHYLKEIMQELGDQGTEILTIFGEKNTQTLIQLLEKLSDVMTTVKKTKGGKTKI